MTPKKLQKIDHENFTFMLTKKERIKVLRHIQWPGYRFVFGVPHPENPRFIDEKAFFQYADVRRKKTIEGFYVDKDELKELYSGFKMLMNYYKYDL